MKQLCDIFWGSGGTLWENTSGRVSTGFCYRLKLGLGDLEVSDRKPALQSKRWHSSVKDGLIKKTHCIMGCVECRFVLAQIFYYHFASSPKSCSMYTVHCNIWLLTGCGVNTTIHLGRQYMFLVLSWFLEEMNPLHSLKWNTTLA